MNMTNNIKWIPVVSDAGSIKVGNESSWIYIPCGDDGTNYYCVWKEEEMFTDSEIPFFTMIGGTNLGIYSYDCGKEIETILEDGRYFVYAGNGRVVFEKSHY